MELSIKQDIKRIALTPVDPVGTSPTPSEPASSRVSTAIFNEWFRAAQDSASAIGRMPPDSGTVRSRIGAVLVRIVKRMLFWYTPQIVGFNTTVLSAIQEQNKMIKQLATDIRDETVARGHAGKIARESLEQLAEADESLSRCVKAVQARLVAADESLLRSVDAVHARLDTSVEEMTRNIQQVVGYIRSGNIARENAERQATGRWQANEAQLIQLRTMLFALKRRHAAPLLPQSVPASSEPAQSQQDPTADNLYLMLEDQLRGSRDDIKVVLAKYLPYVETAAANTKSPVLDIGCGRGEWLELLRDRQISASGVDVNATFVSYCAQLGLTVTLGDAINDLRGRGDQSLGAITGFHIVEHLPWLKLVELIDEAVRVLTPGGIVIFETPNPANVLVGSCNFYFDPTHRNPLPALLLQFLLEARGLSNTEVLPLHPCPESVRVPPDGSVIINRFNEYFYGPQDYGIIARKV